MDSFTNGHEDEQAQGKGLDGCVANLQSVMQQWVVSQELPKQDAGSALKQSQLILDAAFDVADAALSLSAVAHGGAEQTRAGAGLAGGGELSLGGPEDLTPSKALPLAFPSSSPYCFETSPKSSGSKS